MKNHDEMYQSLLIKYNEYQEKRKRRITAVRRIVSAAACIAVMVFSYGVVSNTQKTDMQTFVAEKTESAAEPTEAATTAIAEMELEAPLTTAPVTTAVQTKPPEKRETTTVTTTVTTAEVIKQTEAAPIVTAASSVHTEVQTETTTETTAQTTEKQTETTAEMNPYIYECVQILGVSNYEDGDMPDMNYVNYLFRMAVEYENLETDESDNDTQISIDIADDL